jgi:hypothetical protein
MFAIRYEQALTVAACGIGLFDLIARRNRLSEQELWEKIT